MLLEEKHSRNHHFCFLEYEDMNCLLHCQTSFEAIIVKSGSIHLEWRGRVLTLEENNCALILPYEIHRITTPAKSSVSIAIFSTDYLPDVYDAVRDRSLEQPVFPFLQALLKPLCQGTQDPFALKSALYALASHALSGGIGPRGERRETDLSAQIMFYLQEHFREPVTLQSLAAELGYSYSYTSAIFQKNFHQSFSAVINDYRLQEATSLLLSSSQTITLISQQCGFSTIRNFNMAFKKHFSMTPREYRRLSVSRC